MKADFQFIELISAGKINSIETEVRNFTKKLDEREYNFELKC